MKKKNKIKNTKKWKNMKFLCKVRKKLKYTYFHGIKNQKKGKKLKKITKKC